MKMVIVFDTDDNAGMENTIKMVNHLAAEYMNRGLEGRNQRNFGKIEFIKALRTFARKVIAEEAIDGDGGSLRFAKRFSEEVWNVKLGGERYP
jgi:hypothetical protein